MTTEVPWPTHVPYSWCVITEGSVRVGGQVAVRQGRQCIVALMKWVVLESSRASLLFNWAWELENIFHKVSDLFTDIPERWTDFRALWGVFKWCGCSHGCSTWSVSLWGNQHLRVWPVPLYLWVLKLTTDVISRCFTFANLLTNNVT